MDGAPAPRTTASTIARLGGGFAPVLLVLAIAWGLLELSHPPCPLHPDTHEDLLRARECIETGHCRGWGAMTTVGGVGQGALWVGLLAVSRELGLSVDTIQSITFALAAIGIALVFTALRSRGSLEVAMLAAALLCFGIVWGESLSVLWNPSLTPLPAALLLVLCMRQAVARQRWGALPLGLALGLTLESHPVAALTVPGALLVAGLASPNRRAALLLPSATGVIACGLYGILSPGAAAMNAQWAVETATLPGLALALATISATSALLRARFCAASERRRETLAALAIATPVVLVVGGAWIVSADIPVGSRYFAPAFPAFAFLAAEAAKVLARRHAKRALAVAAAAAAVLSLFVGRPRSGLSLSALEPVAATLESEGVTLDEAWARVSGTDCDQVLGGLAALGLPIAGAPHDLARESLIIEMKGSHEPPRFNRGRWRTISTPAGEVLLGELDTWVDRRRFSACVHTGDDDEGERCLERELGVGITALMAPGDLVMSRLNEPSVEWRDDPSDESRARRVRFEVGIDVPPSAERRTLFIAHVGRRHCTPMRFVAADGVLTSSVLPSETLVVESTDRWQHGTIAIQVDAGECAGYSLEVFPPCLSEVADDDSLALRRLLTPQ